MNLRFIISGSPSAHDGARAPRGLQGRGLRGVRVRRPGGRHGVRGHLHRSHAATQASSIQDRDGPSRDDVHTFEAFLNPPIEKYLKFADNTAKILQTEGYKSKTFCGRHI